MTSSQGDDDFFSPPPLITSSIAIPGILNSSTPHEDSPVITGAGSNPSNSFSVSCQTPPPSASPSERDPIASFPPLPSPSFPQTFSSPPFLYPLSNPLSDSNNDYTPLIRIPQSLPPITSSSTSNLSAHIPNTIWSTPAEATPPRFQHPSPRLFSPSSSTPSSPSSSSSFSLHSSSISPSFLSCPSPPSFSTSNPQKQKRKRYKKRKKKEKAKGKGKRNQVQQSTSFLPTPSTQQHGKRLNEDHLHLHRLVKKPITSTTTAMRTGEEQEGRLRRMQDEERILNLPRMPEVQAAELPSGMSPYSLSPLLSLLLNLEFRYPYSSLLFSHTLLRLLAKHFSSLSSFLILSIIFSILPLLLRDLLLHAKKVESC
jgi:hypothetical protein